MGLQSDFFKKNENDRICAAQLQPLLVLLDYSHHKHIHYSELFKTCHPPSFLYFMHLFYSLWFVLYICCLMYLFCHC